MDFVVEIGLQKLEFISYNLSKVAEEVEEASRLYSI